VWIPVDVVTNASPDAVDVLSAASRHVEAGAIDWTTTYRATRTTDLSMRNGLHLENPFRSWDSGMAIRHSYADEATVVSAGALAVFDWFDRFNIHGDRNGHTDRNGTTGSVGLTQVLTPTTVASINYGFTAQEGTMGNTWNSVPLASGGAARSSCRTNACAMRSWRERRSGSRGTARSASTTASTPTTGGSSLTRWRRSSCSG